MATGASNCNLAIILIDARHGVVEQTKRHSFISRLLGIRHLVVCVNKMDLVDYSEDAYRKIRKDYESFASKLESSEIKFIPISALGGDNVVDRSENMPWYDGAPLLSYLENVSIASDRNLIDLRFPVQNVLRPDLNFRGFAGTLASGVIRKGDEVLALPSRKKSTVKSIVTFDGELDEAFPPMAVTVTLEDEIDISRGDMLVSPRNLPYTHQTFRAMLVWMSDDVMQTGKTYTVKSATNMVPGQVDDIRYAINVNTLHREEKTEFSANDIGQVTVTLQQPICHDSYGRNRTTGSFILIDRITNATVAAGMIMERKVEDDDAATAIGQEVKPISQNIRREDSLVTEEQREVLLNQKPVTIWLTGLSGSGKSTIAQALEQQLITLGHLSYVLDGDNIRHGLNRDLGFSDAERTENIRRISEVAKLMNKAGVIVISAFISPFEADRQGAREIVGNDLFVEVFIDTPLATCEERDPKGLYKKARSGEISAFTGVSSPYEFPQNPEISLPTNELSPEASVEKIVAYLKESGYLA